MKTIRLFLITPALLLLAACISSVHPFYLTSDVTFDPNLVGQWRADQDNEWEQWTFSPGDEGSYVITITGSEEKTAKLIGHLFTLGGRRYLDLVAESCDFAKTQHDIVSVSVFPGHLLVRVDQSENGITLALFDWEWLEKYLTNDPDALAHRREKDSVLLTADTAALQKFVQAHSGEGELYKAAESTLYTRVPAEAAATKPAPTP